MKRSKQRLPEELLWGAAPPPSGHYRPTTMLTGMAMEAADCFKKNKKRRKYLVPPVFIQNQLLEHLPSVRPEPLPQLVAERQPPGFIRSY